MKVADLIDLLKDLPSHYQIRVLDHYKYEDICSRPEQIDVMVIVDSDRSTVLIRENKDAKHTRRTK